PATCRGSTCSSGGPGRIRGASRGCPSGTTPNRSGITRSYQNAAPSPGVSAGEPAAPGGSGTSSVAVPAGVATCADSTSARLVLVANRPANRSPALAREHSSSHSAVTPGRVIVIAPLPAG